MSTPEVPARKDSRWERVAEAAEELEMVLVVERSGWRMVAGGWEHVDRRGEVLALAEAYARTKDGPDDR